MASLGPVSDRTSKFLSTAWLVVMLLWPVALLNYMDRQMMASMKYSVMQDIPSIGVDANWGYMLGQFKWVYAFLSPIGGLIADRFSRRGVVCFSLFAWSAVTWATGQVTDFNSLLWTRTMMGISEAFYMPAALALIADHHIGKSRSTAVGIHQTGMYVGVILGGFTGYVADNPDFGWRSAFDISGLIGILYAFPLFFLLRDAPKPFAVHVTDTSAIQNNQPSVLHSLRELLTNRSFILLVLYFTLPALAGWIVRDWMPAILKDRFHLAQGPAGVYATLFYNTAAFLGVLVGGRWADSWMQRSIRGRIYVSAIGMCLIVPAIFGVGNATTISIAILFLIIYGVGWGFFDCNNMPILSQLVRPNLRATGFGIMNLVSISCGGFADWGFGTLRDMKVPLGLIFGVFSCVAMLSVVLVLLIKPAIKDAPPQDH
ncbi:MFS transporter [bacterium]|nr:MFS transporter [bacterium]